MSRGTTDRRGSVRTNRNARELERDWDWRRRTEPADRRRADPRRHENARGRPVMPMIEEPPHHFPHRYRATERRAGRETRGSTTDRLHAAHARANEQTNERASERARFFWQTRFHYVKQVCVVPDSFVIETTTLRRFCSLSSKRLWNFIISQRSDHFRENAVLHTHTHRHTHTQTTHTGTSDEERDL